MNLVINLPDRTDRKAEMAAQLDRIGWNAEFFEAIRPNEPRGFPSVGAHGCFLSHLGVLKLAKSRGADRLVLMEDDLNFSSEFARSWPAVEEFLQRAQARLFYPAHTMDGDRSNGIVRIASDKTFTCSHFMIFDAEGIDICADGLETILSRRPGHPEGGPMHVDGAYATLRAQNSSLTTFAHFPSLGYQRSSRTDVGKQHWADRFPRLAGTARKLLRRQL